MISDITTTTGPQFQSPPNQEEDLHQAAMHTGAAHAHLHRALRNAKNEQSRRILGLLIDAQMRAIRSMQHLRNGGEKA